MPGPRLTLVVPGLLGPVPATLRDAVADLGPQPGLQRLLARAARSRSAGEDSESLLRAATGGDWTPGGLARAALADGEDAPAAEVWYRAAPVHLRPDRDRLLLFAGPDLYPDTAAAGELAASFNTLFADDGLQLLAADGNWLLGASRAPGPDLPPLYAVAGRYLDAWLPAAVHARPWRRMLNEVQMLFHDHPVNARREAAGLPAVNGLWFWGGGPAAGPGAAPSATVHGNHPLTRGLARLAGQDGMAAPADLSELAPDRDRLALLEAPEAALLGGDVGEWLQALAGFEAAFAAPLMAGGGAGWGAVDLLPGDGRRYRLDRAARWRLWRRARPLRDSVVTV